MVKNKMKKGIMAIIVVLTMTACSTNKGNNDNNWNPAFSIIRTIITGSK